MGKQIKFDLPSDGNQCRDIEQLRDNFNILDVLAHFQSGKLAKWLKVRDNNDYLLLIEAIDRNVTNIDIAQRLCSIFEIDVDKKELDIVLAAMETKDVTQNVQAIKKLIDIYGQCRTDVAIDEKPIKSILIKGEPSDSYTKLFDDDIRMLLIGYKIQGPMSTNNKVTELELKDSTGYAALTLSFQSRYGEQNNIFFDNTYLMKGLSVKFLEKQLKGIYIELMVVDIDDKLYT